MLVVLVSLRLWYCSCGVVGVADAVAAARLWCFVLVVVIVVGQVVVCDCGVIASVVVVVVVDVGVDVYVCVVVVVVVGVVVGTRFITDDNLVGASGRPTNVNKARIPTGQVEGLNTGPGVNVSDN